MNFKNTIFIAVIILFLFQLVVMKQDAQIKEAADRPTIALSTFSLYDIAKNILGDTAEPFMILPLGVDAHSYEPSPKEVIKLYKSDLVVYSGAGLEPWIDGFDFKNRAIDMSLHVNLKNLTHEYDEDNQNHTKVDPHYWLDIQNMIKATELITKEFTVLFPANKELYNKNRDNYVEMLITLHKDYKEKLSTCKLSTIIVNHNAFSYLSSSYGFNVKAISGLSPDAQPSAKSMLNLIEHVKEHNVSTIFFESFASDKAIKSIANEAKVSVDALQPLGNITANEAEQNLSYEDIMRSNLEKISKALVCK
ncbi:metal ABC transporter substrate-binding protein [Candidatus Sulfurimonas marisnigri]|nr:metal ABC transporter substrate-binding protein [Candidatus Sulfurimonas marisnigri]